MQMDFYRDKVASMSDSQRSAAIQSGFTAVNDLADAQRSDVLLGICAAAAMYSTNIANMGSMSSSFNDLSSFIQTASALDDSERFEAGMKGFFLVNNFPTSQRDTIFTGFYASAYVGHIDVDLAAQAQVPVQAGRADPVW